MKCICKREELNKNLFYFSEFVKKGQLNKYSNILFSVKNNILTMKSTDMLVSAVIKMSVISIEDGETSIYYDVFSNLIRSLVDENVYIESEENYIYCYNENRDSSFNLKSLLNPEDFEIIEEKKKPIFQIRADILQKMIKTTVFSIGDEKNQQSYFRGAYLKAEDDKLLMVATDGKKFSIIKTQMDKKVFFNPVIVPKKVLKTVEKVLLSVLKDNPEAILKIATDENKIYFDLDDIFIYSFVINEKYPNYESIIPSSFKNNAEVSVKEAISAINLITLISSSKTKKIMIKFTKNLMTIFGDEKDLGTGHQKIECIYDGKDAEINMNYEYLIEPLNIMESTKFSFSFNSEDKVCCLKEKGNEDSFHLIMPMKK